MAGREPFKQATKFGFAEYTPLAKRPKVKKRIRERVSPGNQFEQPHFRRAKSSRVGGKLFEQVE